MTGLDGATIDQFTGGINTPANGQQGYFAIADQQEPYPNLEYVSPAEAAALLRDPLLASTLAESDPGAVIAVAPGTHVVTWTFPFNYGRSIQGFTLRATVYSATAVQYHVERRLTVATGSAGTITASEGAQIFAMASGWTLSNGASGSTITATLTSATAAAHNVHVSISRHYLKVF